MNVLSLFSGIGALDCGLELAGMTVVAQVEQDPLRRAILARHWPDLPQHDDVTTFAQWWQQEDRPHVHLVAGGPPCQPFSQAGLRYGIADERWMWPAMADVIRLVRPSWVLLENVSELAVQHRDAFGRILADLADLRFDAEWTVLPACAVGAPHPRKRLFLVANTHEVDGTSRLGAWPTRPRPVQAFDDRARAWRHQVDQAVASAAGDARDAGWSALELVAAGGDAVVVQVAEWVGRLIMEAAA